jgi:hypothetical protein
VKAYFSSPSGDEGVRVSFEAEDNSDQYLLELLAEKGVVQMSEADDEKEDAFAVVDYKYRRDKVARRPQS